MARKLIKFLILLILLAVSGLAVYAYLGDLSPEQVEIDVPVTLEQR